MSSGNKNNKHWVLLVAVLQLAVLVFVAGKREWIMSQGETVFLRTAPVDPRDLFRGDYVELQYDIARLDKEIINRFEQENEDVVKGLLADKKNREVYLRLKFDENNLAEPVSLSLDKPAEGLFIKGRMGRHIWHRWRNRGDIKFGIEKYFLEQGTGWAIERKRGQRNDWQTSMEVEVALGGDGTAVIKGYRWSSLGVRLEVLQTPVNINARNVTIDDNTRLSPALRISLKNLSDKPQALVIDEKNHCEFQLLKNSNRRGAILGHENIKLVNRDCSEFEAGQYSVKTLEPGQQHKVEIDMLETQWHVQHEDQVMQIGKIPNNWEGYRWVYHPLPEEKLAAEDRQKSLWLSSIFTAAFRANGRID